MKTILVATIAGTMLLLAVGEAGAQQHPSGAAALVLAALMAAPASPGAFETLSAANQKTARALYEAQRASTSRLKLTLEQIAARRSSGQGWGEIFYTMKAHGLVKEQSVSQVLASYEHAK